MKRVISILGIIILCASLLVACDDTKKASSGNQMKILLTMNQVDTFRQTLIDAAQKQADAAGTELTVKIADNVIENQVEHIKLAVKEGYDAILCAPVSTDTIVELEANAKDIPIVFMNSSPDEKQLKEGKYVYAGSDEETAGKFQAEYVLNKYANKSEINVVLLKGEKTHSGAIGRTEGVKQAFAESGKKINYVFDDYADWDTEKAMQMFKIFLKTGQPVDCVICNNDGMALGVVKACREAGIDFNKVMILGVDATTDACAAIEKGEMAFTVYQSASGQGKAAVEVAIRLAGGESVKDIDGASDDGKYVWVPFEKVDASNVKNY